MPGNKNKRLSLMQKGNPIRRVVTQPTDLSEIAETLLIFLQPLHEQVQGAASAGAALTTGKGNNSVVYVDADESCMRCRLSMMIRFFFGAVYSFEDDTAHHGGDLGCSPCSIGGHVGYRERFIIVVKIECGDHRHNVSVVNTGLVSYGTELPPTHLCKTHKLM